MCALRIGNRRQQVDGTARPVHQGGAAERDAGVEKTLMLAIKCCAPDYVAEAQGLPDLRTFPSNLRNIIFRSAAVGTIRSPTPGDRFMFELLFTRPSAIARYRCAPLLNERLAYLARCEQVGIKPSTLRRIASHQLDLVRTLDLRDDEGLNPGKIAAGVRQWSLPEKRLSQPRARRRFFSDAERWLRFLGWLEEPEVACHTHTRYASGEYRLRGWSGMSEGVRSGLDTAVVSTSRRDTIADVGCDGEVGGRAAWGNIDSAAVERDAEATHCRRELPLGGFGCGGGATQRRQSQRVVSRIASWNPHGDSPVCSVDESPGMTKQSEKRREPLPSPFS